MQCIKDILFPAAVESVFGGAFLQHHSTACLQQAFLKFEEGFELAASPLPHFLQPSFCEAKKTLLEAFRCQLFFFVATVMQTNDLFVLFQST